MNNLNAMQMGMVYGEKMNFKRYYRMLERFTSGQINLITKGKAQQFIVGAYIGYIRANPGCSFR